MQDNGQKSPLPRGACLKLFSSLSVFQTIQQCLPLTSLYQIDVFPPDRYNKKGKTEEDFSYMRLMIASDIHGSARYCDRMIRAYEREKAERLLLLGDILYHGPRNDLPEGYAPKEVAAMLNERKDHLLCVRGNCDTEVDQMVLDFPVLAEYCLLELPCSNAQNGETGPAQRMSTVFATHGHVYNPGHLPPLKEGDILLNGHTHIPARGEILDENGARYMYLNPGSVSIPKEGSQHSYMIWENGIFTWKNLEGEAYMTWKTDSRF